MSCDKATCHVTRQDVRWQGRISGDKTGYQVTWQNVRWQGKMSGDEISSDKTEFQVKRHIIRRGKTSGSKAQYITSYLLSLSQLCVSNLLSLSMCVPNYSLWQLTVLFYVYCLITVYSLLSHIQNFLQQNLLIWSYLLVSVDWFEIFSLKLEANRCDWNNPPGVQTGVTCLKQPTWRTTGVTETHLEKCRWGWRQVCWCQWSVYEPRPSQGTQVAGPTWQEGELSPSSLAGHLSYIWIWEKKKSSLKNH